MRCTVTLADKHDLGLLAAFLTMRSDGTLDQVVDFNGATFPAGTPLESTFKFNSYRLTYRYLLLDSPKFRFSAGLSAKLRDAAIRLKREQGDRLEWHLGVARGPHFAAGTTA